MHRILQRPKRIFGFIVEEWEASKEKRGSLWEREDSIRNLRGGKEEENKQRRTETATETEALTVDSSVRSRRALEGSKRHKNWQALFESASQSRRIPAGPMHTNLPTTHRNWRGEGRCDLIFKCKQIYIVAKAPPPVTQNRGLRISPQNVSRIFSIIGCFFLPRLRVLRNKNDRDRCGALKKGNAFFIWRMYLAGDLFIVGTPGIGYF